MRIRGVFIIIFAFYLMPDLLPQPGAQHQQYFMVKHVVDGDTFWIDDGSIKGLKIRLIGIDAPESRSTGRKEVSYFGKEASGYLEKLIGGKRVRLEFDAGRYDRYGRTLAYVYLEDGTFVNARLVRDGYATVMTVPPNIRYANTFLRLERKARSQKRGMWGG